LSYFTGFLLSELEFLSENTGGAQNSSASVYNSSIITFQKLHFVSLILHFPIIVRAHIVQYYESHQSFIVYQNQRFLSNYTTIELFPLLWSLHFSFSRKNEAVASLT